MKCDAVDKWNSISIPIISSNLIWLRPSWVDWRLKRQLNCFNWNDFHQIESEKLNFAKCLSQRSTVLHQKVRDNFAVIFDDTFFILQKSNNAWRWPRSKNPRLTMVVEKAFVVIHHREHWDWTVSISFPSYSKLKNISINFNFTFSWKLGRPTWINMMQWRLIFLYAFSL